MSLRRHSEVEHCDWPSSNYNNVFRSFMHFLTSVCAIVGGVFTGLLSFLFYSSLACAYVHLCGHVYTCVHSVVCVSLTPHSCFISTNIVSRRCSCRPHRFLHLPLVTRNQKEDRARKVLMIQVLQHSSFVFMYLSSTMFVDLTQKIPLYP